MTHLEHLPLWVAVPAALFLVLGAGLAFLGSVGLFRLRSFYDRIHAPTLGTSWGMAGVVVASVLVSSAGEGRPVLHDLVIAAFITITTPVTLMLLGRAVLYRDRSEAADASERVDQDENR